MKNELTEVFAAEMRKRRKAIGLTQKALAELLHYSEKAISKWESAVALPPSSILLPLAEALACGVDDLLCRSGSSEYFLGIDGGGTKTDFALVDKEGRLVRREILGASNPVDIGIDNTLRCLSEGIVRVCAGISVRKVSVFAGLAGGSSSEYKNAILKHLEGLGFAKSNCGSDADSIVEAGLYVDGAAHDGVVVIMGTGSVVFLRKNGVKTRFGGYGYLLGDMGCGFSLGRDAICAALYEEEGTAEHTAITELVRARTGKARALEALADFYSGGKREIASYAPIVFEAYDLQDAVAERILQSNARYIADAVSNAAERMGNERPVRVVIAGGLTRRSDVLVPMIEKSLKDISMCSISIYEEPVVKGALLLAGAKKIGDLTT